MANRPANNRFTWPLACASPVPCAAPDVRWKARASTERAQRGWSFHLHPLCDELLRSLATSAQCLRRFAPSLFKRWRKWAQLEAQRLVQTPVDPSRAQRLDPPDLEANRPLIELRVKLQRGCDTVAPPLEQVCISMRLGETTTAFDRGCVKTSSQTPKPSESRRGLDAVAGDSRRPLVAIERASGSVSETC